MERPNIVLLVLDTVRHDYLWRQAAGGALCANIEALAERGVSFENAVSPGPHTCPSHASFFTGMLPNEHGIYAPEHAMGGRLPVPSLVERLRQSGYACLGYSGNPFIAPGTALGSGFDTIVNEPRARQSGQAERFVPRLLRWLRYTVRPEPRDARRRRFAEAAAGTMRSAVRMFRSVWPAKPVFLFCNVMAAHDPRLFTPDDAEYTRPQGCRERELRPHRFHSDVVLDELGVRPMSQSQLARLHWSYAASVRCADRVVGDLINALDGELAPERTDLFVVADHGELLGEYGFFEHNTFLYEPLVHVPMIVRSEALPAGARCERQVQSHWLWSFIAERAGIAGEVDVPHGQGSLTAALSTAEGEAPAYSFADPEGQLARLRRNLSSAIAQGVDSTQVAPGPVDAHLQAVRLGGKALIATCSGQRRAFDLAGGMEKELAGAPCEQVRAELKPHLLPMAAESGDAPGPAAAADPAVLDRLRELGYAE